MSYYDPDLSGRRIDPEYRDRCPECGGECDEREFVYFDGEAMCFACVREASTVSESNPNATAHEGCVRGMPGEALSNAVALAQERTAA